MRSSPAGTTGRTLVLAGHFHPSVGGIQTFTEEILLRCDPERLVVVAPTVHEDEDSPTRLSCPLVRMPRATGVLRLAEVVREYGCRSAWIPAAAPYGLVFPALRRAGVRRLVVSTHGQEVGWLRAGVLRAPMLRVLRDADAVTVLGDHTARRLGRVVPAERMHRLAGGVDERRFPVRTTPPGLSSRPTVVVMSRLVRRKGVDVLLRSWPLVLGLVPAARLVVIGDGPMRSTLVRTAESAPMRGSVSLLGLLPHRRRLEVLHAADVFVAPSRDRWGGIQSEGLGLATLEASATGLPVVVGRSGGSPDTVIAGRTGVLVDARHPGELAAAVVGLLNDHDRARRLGEAGAAWVRESWTWESAAERLRLLLHPERRQVPKMVW